MRRVCVFDVNHTLLDLGALDPHFERVFARPGVRQQWFALLLSSAFLATITGAYSDFGSIGRASLRAIAERHSAKLSATDENEIVGTWGQLPPHPDVVPALDHLTRSGFRVAALTNSTEAVAIAQMEHAGLADRFERILSADTVRRLKPAPEPYEMAARELDVPIDGIRLIAAHGWDVAGALRAGASAAFVARSGAYQDPLVGPPDIVAPDLVEAARLIIESER